MSLFVENLAIAAGELRANPFRSALTTLGIVIAVSAVVAVVSIVQGASRFMLEQFEGLGANVIWVFPQRPPGVEGRKLGRIELTYDDAKALERRCPALAAVAPVVQRQMVARLGALETTCQVIGTTPEYQRTRNWYPDAGRFFLPAEVDARANVCVVGEEVLKKLKTSRERLLGQRLVVQGQSLLVVGFLEPKGAMLGASQDDLIVVPITTVLRMVGEGAGRRLLITAQAKDPALADQAIDQIRWNLRLRHGLRADAPDDFGVFTQDQFLQSFQKVSVMVTGLLIGIVSVALLVGGIGIMNIMLVSVSERTREIGIRKALGAKNRDILLQFLVEAITLGALGGVVGIGLGFLAGLVTREAISVWVDFPPVFVPVWAVALALGFSGSVGLISGIYPAWKAARLDPIEALRAT
ncbi:MAG: ABC transporter permease [Planctomycetes bacterium]|nr:ABC transporter permease [Planctomycetota bacterium]